MKSFASLGYVILIVLTAGCASLAASRSLAVVHLRADAGRTAAYGLAGIRSQPQVGWRAPLGSLTMGTPLVADGLVYSGGSDGALYAFDAATGQKAWSAGGFEIIESALVVAGDLIIGGGFNKEVRAMDRRTGTKRWSYNASAFVFAAPLVIGDRVFVATYDKLHALDLATGAWKWDADTGGEMTFVSSPASDGTTIFLAVGSSLVAYDVMSGEERWRIRSAKSYWSLAVANGLVYVGNSNGYLYALDQATGEERWKFASTFRSGDDIWSAPAVRDGVVYAGSRDQRLYAVDALTGHQHWFFAATGPSVSDPVLAGDVVYFTDANHELPLDRYWLYALDVRTGLVVWQWSIRSTLLGTPGLADGQMFVPIAGAVLALAPARLLLLPALGKE